MPDVMIVNDNASFTSSTTYSTQDSEQPPRPLHRRNTVTQLTRRVSKRISQSILGSGVQEHQLSEKNLKDLNEATQLDAPGSPASYLPDQSHEPMIYEPIHEDIEEDIHSVDVEAVRDMRLQQSYAAFCRDFTMSGTPTVNRKFDLNMEMEHSAEATPQSRANSTHGNDRSDLNSPHDLSDHIVDIPGSQPSPRPNSVPYPISCTSMHQDLHMQPPQSATTRDPPLRWPELAPSKVEHDYNRYGSHTSHYPHPPPRIITPTVWMDMQRTERERKEARRSRLLAPFRSWFMTSPPSWGRRYEVVE
ncbi:hypothetical protein PENANT_c019G08773 [Penicillium antarcticum]|uniref:Uncharacterized protein n=1 Tax=Penicillium antarcticum TaxID=416450 RepID=A0A1V6Q153_9EURO|nr:uncharacterized protein N7508_001181 [Penicillium antarcticum]KAJ5316673.1 hypothetical protein N7508_001181 [Penicillium antarcticum]OQD82955.1 hypothetical protein PENANT_c019G08773 [Penicillium antarcticum]